MKKGKIGGLLMFAVAGGVGARLEDPAANAEMAVSMEARVARLERAGASAVLSLGRLQDRRLRCCGRLRISRKWGGVS